MSLSLDGIVSVTYTLNPKAAMRPGYNIGLIIGESTVIPTSERLRLYTDLAGMLSDGFTTSSSEYLAARLYFSQSPAPGTIYVGVAGDTEDPVAVMTDCLQKDPNWYAFVWCDANAATITALAAWAESAEPAVSYFYTTQDQPVLQQLKDNNYFASHGMYSTTTSNAVASVMGYAMGANTQLANSAYTLAYITLPGVLPESAAESLVQTILGLNGNIYVARGNTYYVYQQGTQANGAYFDEKINLDQLANNVQMSVMDQLKSRPKVPQTEDGVSSIIAAITPEFERARRIGFVAPGVWLGPQILSLNTGDALPNGYTILTDSIAGQSQFDRDARKAPGIYCPIKLAGAIEHVIISIPVNR